jgi:hypothetical protein
MKEGDGNRHLLHETKPEKKTMAKMMAIVVISFLSNTKEE